MRQHADVGDRHHRDRERAGDEPARVGERDRRQAERRQRAGERADESDMRVGDIRVCAARVRRRAEPRGDDRRAGDRDQHARPRGRDAPQQRDAGETAAAERERREIDPALRDGGGEARDLVDERAAERHGAEQARQLARDQRQREPVQIAVLNRLGQQIGDEAQLQQAGEHAKAAGHQRERGRERDRVRGLAVRERRDRAGDQRGERRIGAEHQDPAWPEDRVADERGDRRVQAGDDRQARRLSVAHADRHEHRGQRDARVQIPCEPRAPVRAQRRDARQPAPPCLVVAAAIAAAAPRVVAPARGAFAFGQDTTSISGRRGACATTGPRPMRSSSCGCASTCSSGRSLSRSTSISIG